MSVILLVLFVAIDRQVQGQALCTISRVCTGLWPRNVGIAKSSFKLRITEGMHGGMHVPVAQQLFKSGIASFSSKLPTIWGMRGPATRE